FLIWLVAAYLTFVAFWPAAWVDPLGRPAAVFQNAFISATDEEEASEEGFGASPISARFTTGSTARSNLARWSWSARVWLYFLWSKIAE
ncbi:MAG: hypothetical protein HC875_41120, partial [Anaerolineales bacterium]|nr:hypothetical protein [Anaerolineales bacterium]